MMYRWRAGLILSVALACALLWGQSLPGGRASAAVLADPVLQTTQALAAVQLPARLSNEEFWALSRDASEPDGFFRSDNLTSNELLFQYVIPDLVSRNRGGVYLGVGPEQNYTYIAELKPPMVVIFDIRRGNMLLQLMYKAVFELSKDRADFVAMLFSRPRPAGLTAGSTADELFRAFGRVPADEALYGRSLKAIQAHLTETRALPLSSQDLDGIRFVFSTFADRGFALRSSPTYAELMTAVDAAGVHRSYLASEERFLVLKALQEKNLVVPVVGDFSGPRAIRTVGAWLKARGATVAAFYLSNVEQYLVDGKWDLFCRNVATLPLTPSSTFIRSSSGGGGGRGFVSSLGAMAEETRGCR